MTYQQFVEKLRKVPASFEAYQSIGVSENFIKNRIKAFNLQRLDSSFVDFEDEVLKLIRNYDLSKISIGMVTFLSEIDQDANGFIFGELEADPLFVFYEKW